MGKSPASAIQLDLMRLNLPFAYLAHGGDREPLTLWLRLTFSLGLNCRFRQKLTVVILIVQWGRRGRDCNVF